MACICAICGFRKDITTDFNKWPLIMGKSSEIYPVTRGGNPDKEVNDFLDINLNIFYIFLLHESNWKYIHYLFPF